MRAASPDEFAALFERAVNTPASERADVLASAYLDEESRTRIDRLLAAYDSASDALKDLMRSSLGGARAVSGHVQPAAALGPLPSTATPRSAAETDPLGLVGSMLSRFEIEDVVGRGGFGVVYRARDARLGRTVALKCFYRDVSREDVSKQRFLQEARAASALDHPNIAVTYEAGEFGGVLYIAMAYYRGETLRTKLARGALDLSASIDYARQAARGLVYSHRQGIVHCDVKPENLIATDEGVLKILDFGLARVTNVTLSRSDARLGTCAYMSPEQVRGEALDARSDVWSLGVVLYEMLTGVRPFHADYEPALFYHILYEDPQPLRAYLPDVPGALDAVVSRCLRPRDGGRYASASDLLSDLDILAVAPDAVSASSTPVAPGRGALLARLRTHRLSATDRTLAVEGSAALRPFRLSMGRARSRRFLSLAVAATVAAVLLMSTFVDFGTREPPLPDQLHLAVLPFDNINGDPVTQAFADGLVYSLASKLAGFDDFEDRLAVVSARDVLESGVRSAARAQELFGVNLVISGSVHRDGDGVRLTLDLVDAESGRILRPLVMSDEVRGFLNLQSEVALDVVGQLDLELNASAGEALTAGGTTVPGAYDFYVQGLGYVKRFEEEGAVDAAIALFGRAIESDSTYALAHAGLAEAYWRKFSTTFSAAWAAAAARHGERAIALDERVAPAWTALGLIYLGTAEYEAAERALRRALELEPRNATAHLYLAMCHELRGQMDLAGQNYEEALVLHPGSWEVQNEVGRFHLRLGRYQEAAELFRRVIELRPDNPWGYNNLAVALRGLGRIDEAFEMLERAATVNPNAAGAVSLARRNLADLYVARGDLPAAVEELEEALRRSGTKLDVWFDLARTYIWTGENEKASGAWREAIVLLDSLLAVNPRDAHAVGQLAVSYAALDRRGEAYAALDRLGRMDRREKSIDMLAAEAYLILGEREEALSRLEAGLRRGLPLINVTNSPWLSKVRHERDVAALLSRYMRPSTPD